MEPRQGMPELPRVAPPLQSGENFPFSNVNAERAGEATHERAADQPQGRELESALPVVVPVPAPIQPMPTVATQQHVDDSASNPAVAADNDLIEKEWVDKIKKVIEATKENPYQRELEIGKLQRDYIRKRYGREIGEPANG